MKVRKHRKGHLIHVDSPPVTCDCPIHGESYLVGIKYVNPMGTRVWTCEHCMLESILKYKDLEIKHDSEVPPPIPTKLRNNNG